MKKLGNSSAAVIAILSALTLSAHAQTPPPEEVPTVELQDIRIEEASLPGSDKKWTKILVDFTSSESWTDGILLTAQVALSSRSDQMRTASGDVRYANVPAGAHTAIFYLSPSATARFGSPVAVNVRAFHRDREAGEKFWARSGGVTAESMEALRDYPGILVNVLQTPWLLIDYEKSPDVVGQ